MIKGNDIIKMKIFHPAKSPIGNTPHYYLCWKKLSVKHNFFIFTSNFFKLFAKGIAGPDDIAIIHNNDKLPFTKETYLVLKESYNLTDMTEKDGMFKLENAFGENEFIKLCEKGNAAVPFDIDNYIIL